MDTSDRDLIERVLGGDPTGLQDLVRRHAGPLWSTLRRSLRDLEDARDVFQETWLRALQRLDTVRDAARLRSWLLSIALNLVRQRRRREGLVGTEPLEALGEGPVDDREDGLERASRRELAAALATRIAELPGRQREVVDLRVNHGLAYAEIAEHLGIREDACRASYYQALRKLRASFDELTIPGEGT